MKPKFFVSFIILIIFLFFTGSAGAAGRLESPLGTSFTYQGLLKNDGQGVNDDCDFIFSLWNDPFSSDSGAQVGSPVPQPNVPVSDGYFTVQLDFGAGVFDGGARWLEVEVMCSGDADYTTLSPRQELTATPYSFYSQNADRLDDQHASDFAAFIHSHDNAYVNEGQSNSITAEMIIDGSVSFFDWASNGCDTGQVPKWTGSGWGCGDDIDTVNADADTFDGQHSGYYLNASNINTGTLGTNYYSAYTDLGTEGFLGNAAGDLALNNGSLQSTLNSDLLDGQHSTALWNLNGNIVAFEGTLGTNNNYAMNLVVNNYRILRLDPNMNIIGGYSGNWVTGGVIDATIGGGGDATDGANRVTDHFGTISGGSNNLAGDNAGSVHDKQYATVGGGIGNIAGGAASVVGGGGTNTAGAQGATVSGGESNTANGIDSTIGGGQWNSSNGQSATVIGGEYNLAGGDFSVVVGGDNNSAEGTWSLAAGRNANADHNGSFVWADSRSYNFSSTTTNEFSVRATGGVRFVSGVDGIGNPIAGVVLEPGSGSWSSLSDANLKSNYIPVDGQSILTALVEMPINTWNYKAQDASIRHIGPTAQDFQAAFGVGEDDTHISTVDADGVALAGIKALAEENKALQQQVTGLEQRLSSLENKLGSESPQSFSAASVLSQGGWGWLVAAGVAVAWSWKHKRGGMK